MARVIQRNPLYVVEGILDNKTNKADRVVPNQGTKMERFAQYLKIAEGVVSSKAVGAVANLAVKGITKLGDAAEEATLVASAKRAQEDQGKLNQTENAALKAKAMERLAASRAVSASGEAELKMGEKYSSDKNAYFQGLKEQQGTFDPGNTKPLIEYLRKGIAAGYLDERDAEGFTKMLVEKVGNPTMAEYEKQEAGLLVKEGQLKEILKTSEKPGYSTLFDDMERLAELEEDPAIRQGLLDDAAEIRSNNAADLEKWTDKAVDTPVVKPPVVAKEYFPKMGETYDILQKITDRGPDAIKRAVITLKDRNNPRDKELYTLLVDYYTGTYGKGAVPKETAEQEIFAPEAARIAAVDADVAGMNTAADALMQRKAVLPEGVSYNEATGAYVIERAKRLNQSEILTMAAGADTPEKRISVLRAIEDGDVSSTSLFDIMTGGHKKRLASEAAKLFPKIPAAKVTKISKTPETITAEIELSNARRDKVKAETKEIPTDSESERARKKAAEGVDTQRALDLQKKNEAKVNLINYWESVILAGLRKPAARRGRRGKTPEEKAKSVLGQLEKDRDAGVRKAAAEGDESVKGIEREVGNLVAKNTQLLSTLGVKPVPPNTDDSPRREREKQNATYAKDSKDYNDTQKAIADVEEKIKKKSAELKTARDNKRNNMEAKEKAYDNLINDAKDKAYGKGSGHSLPQDKPPAKAKTQAKPEADL